MIVVGSRLRQCVHNPILRVRPGIRVDASSYNAGTWYLYQVDEKGVAVMRLGSCIMLQVLMRL